MPPDMDSRVLQWLRSRLDLLPGNDELARAEVVDGAQLGRDLVDGAVSPVGECASVCPRRNNLGNDEVVHVLGVPLRDELALQPAHTTAHQGRGNAGGIKGLDAKALKFISVSQVSSGTAPYSESQISKCERRNTECEFS